MANLAWDGPREGAQPLDGTPRPGNVVLCHGFARSPDAMLPLAWRCQVRGLRTCRPATAMFGRHGLNSACAVRDLGDVVASLPGVRERLVLAGHSAGASVAVALGDRLAELGVVVAGLVLIDGVDNRAHMARRLVDRAATHDAPPILLVDSEPSRCNRHGALTRAMLASMPGVAGWRVRGAGHGDVERWIAGAPGIPAPTDARRRARPGLAYRLACSDRADEGIAGAVQALAAAAISALAAHGGRVRSRADTAWSRAALASIVTDADLGAETPRQAEGMSPLTTLLPGSTRED